MDRSLSCSGSLAWGESTILDGKSVHHRLRALTRSHTPSHNEVSLPTGLLLGRFSSSCIH